MRFVHLALSVAICGTLVGQPAREAAASRFNFVAMGCVPYGRVENSRSCFLRLLREVDRIQPAFAVHLGDILGGNEKPADEVLRQRRDDFDSVNGALIYTPGDNEWTDSHSPGQGSFEPLERLEKIRALFFTEDSSRGRNPLRLDTQRHDPRFSKYAENARWTVSGVVFATVHVVGSSNNVRPSVPSAMEEWQDRDLADEAWIEQTFDVASKKGAPGIVLFFHADPFAADRGQAGVKRSYERFLKTVERGARDFARPVLLVHADEHRYRLDVGMRFELSATPLQNVTRLETFGDSNIHAVLVTVDPESPQVFLAGPLIVPGNPVPRLPK